MTEYLFPDNTVLCSFAAVYRLDILRRALNARGRWTAAVEYEASRSSAALPALDMAQLRQWLNDPIEITAEFEIERIERIRRVVFGGTDDKPLQHLGEAETCLLIKERPEFAGSWWITDDREALRYARFQGITTRETVDLIAVTVSYGDLTAQEGFDLLSDMAAKGRHLRLPTSPRELV